MTPAGEKLRSEIEGRGPIPFRRFMEVALYDPEHGYYRRARDPFGRQGDFYTAEQVQPVFGRLAAALIRGIHQEMGTSEEFTVVELGAGRGEMAKYFRPWRYIPVEAGAGAIPTRFTGVVFANEFFDALPVDVVVRRGGRLLLRRVAWSGNGFVFVDGEEAGSEMVESAERYGAPAEEGDVLEVNLAARQAIHDVARSLERGRLIAIDYGYTTREIVRFPAGSLMSYRRHCAYDDVLSEPGDRDITAHVNFSALQGWAEEAGMQPLRFESMARMLLRAGEADQFGEALRAADEVESLKLRLQLKTLLYGMGETFRVAECEK